jgi:2-polyprenyl-3-methyl-5-hydroxy-6-metoxy-1,4-benzoquinol methylase
VLRYDCDLAKLPPELARTFVRLAEDDATRAFVARAPHGKLGTLARRALGSVLSDYDANALLDFYPMHLLSTAQWRVLLGEDPGGRLLDVGAGSGDVLSALAPLFREVTTTETSRGMARTLRARGYVCHGIDLAEAALPPHSRSAFDVVSLLHVLDRARHPLTLLARATALVASGGALLVATPLPLSTHVHVAGGTVDAEEVLPTDDDASEWEPALCSLVTRVLAPLGLAVERVTRAPYLSRGDADTPLYSLDDAILVLRRSAP